MTVAAYLPSVKPNRTTAPTFVQEPVTVDEAKQQCRVAESNHADDSFFRRLIVQAREQLERDATIACYTGTFTFKKTCWTEFAGREWFELNLRPVTAVTSITYVATDGDTDTWSSTEYTFDGTYGVVPTIRLNYGYVWPTLRGDINGITITTTAGYASVAAMPERIKQAVLLHVHYHWLLSAGITEPRIWETYQMLADDLARQNYS
jgi:uncharacterized phiE125 gp8 family phage protein